MDPQTILTPDVLGQLISPLALVIALVGSLIAMLIPAFMYWLLMQLIFRETVRFLPILLIMAVLSVLFYFAFLALAFFAPDVIAPALRDDDSPAALIYNFGGGALLLLIQSVALSFAVWNERGDMIAVWKWLVVALLQIGVFIILSIGLAFALL